MIEIIQVFLINIQFCINIYETKNFKIESIIIPNQTVRVFIVVTTTNDEKCLKIILQ